MFLITSYKSKIASRYIPVDAEQIGIKIPESEIYFTSIKLDGHLAFMSVKKGKAQLFDKNGNEIKVDSVTKAAERLKSDCVLAGEVCVFQNGKSTSNREVNASLNNPDKVDFRFGVFDLLEVNGAECDLETEEKIKIISDWLQGCKEIFAIEQNKFESRKDIISFFKTAYENKAEGLVVKLPNGTAYKVKKVHHLDLVVLGYAETNGEKAGVLRELLLGCALGNNHFQIITKCGVGFSEKERTEFIKQLEPLIISSEYTEVSGAKTAFIFVKPEMVVEISCLDLINENSNGPIKKAILNFEKTTYTIVGNMPTLSVISPNFVRLREDKKANENDTGTFQAYTLCEPLSMSATIDQGTPSEIILREIFTKNGKDGTSIRKLVALKTNKEKSGSYSPFVVVYSDFSAGRKKPLDQEIFLCKNEKEAAAKIVELKDLNIKKGWEQIN